MEKGTPSMEAGEQGSKGDPEGGKRDSSSEISTSFGLLLACGMAGADSTVERE